MPYSKDPLKYPYAFEVFLKGLEGRTDVMVRQKYPDRSEAVRNRVMMQSYLSAVGKKSEKLESLWGTVMRETVAAKGDKTAETRMEGYRTEAAKWQAMARTAAALMVRSMQESDGKWVVEIKTRSAGDFEAMLIAAVGGEAKVGTRAAGVHVADDILKMQDEGRDWLETGKAGARWLAGLEWEGLEDGERVKILAGAMLEVLGDPQMAAKQADAAASLLVMKRMQEMRRLANN